MILIEESRDILQSSLLIMIAKDLSMKWGAVMLAQIGSKQYLRMLQIIGSGKTSKKPDDDRLSRRWQPVRDRSLPADQSQCCKSGGIRHRLLADGFER